MVGEKKARSASKLFWGRTATLPLYMRVGGLVFVIATIASMSFCQFGFWPMGEIDNDPVYLVLLVAPVVMGAFAFGPITGTLIGLFGGLIAFAHGVLLPLDFLEAYYFGTPTNTVGLFGLTALLAGVLFDVALKRDPQGGKRVALIIVVSFIASFFASALSFVNMVMLVGGFDLFTLAHWYLAVLGVAGARRLRAHRGAVPRGRLARAQVRRRRFEPRIVPGVLRLSRVRFRHRVHVHGRRHILGHHGPGARRRHCGHR